MHNMNIPGNIYKILVDKCVFKGQGGLAPFLHTFRGVHSLHVLSVLQGFSLTSPKTWLVG